MKELTECDLGRLEVQIEERRIRQKNMVALFHSMFQKVEIRIVCGDMTGSQLEV